MEVEINIEEIQEFLPHRYPMSTSLAILAAGSMIEEEWIIIILVYLHKV